MKSNFSDYIEEIIDNFERLGELLKSKNNPKVSAGYIDLHIKSLCLGLVIFNTFIKKYYGNLEMEAPDDLFSEESIARDIRTFECINMTDAELREKRKNER